MENLTYLKNRFNKNQKKVQLERAVKLFINKTKQYQT